METVGQIVPSNEKGKSLDLEHSVNKESFAEAGELFRLASRRLLRPWLWHELAGDLTAEFRLPESKEPKDKNAVSIGENIEINIPAPGIDWVRVKNIERNFIDNADQSIAFTLMVAANPLEQSGGVDHFFESGATSTFIITQSGTAVTASYHGRNETPNTETEGIGETIRNVIIAIGAIAGFSELQWMALLKGLLDDEKLSGY